MGTIQTSHRIYTDKEVTSMRSLRPFAVVVLSASLLGLASPASAAPAPTTALHQSPGSSGALSMAVSPIAALGVGWSCRFLPWC